MAVARARADHQTADEPRIFTDPLAERIVGPAAPRTSDFDRDLDDVVRRRRLMIAARSRFADDTVAAAIVAGTRQVVVLGAGLDTSAYRNTHSDVRFFEVDHPDTQAWKRHRLAESGVAVPDTLTFAPVDFERTDLGEGLSAAGFDRSGAVVFVWLGVVMYLTRASLTQTLRYLGGQDAPAEVVLDYLYPPSGSAAQQARADRVAAVGEPWIGQYTAEEIGAELSAAGFARIQDLPAAEIVARYTNRTASGTSDSGPHLIHASTA